MNRWLLFAGGLVASVLVTALLWVLGVPGFFLFLFFPFFLLPLGRGRQTVPPRQCPACGLASRDPDVRHCPRDGQRLL